MLKIKEAIVVEGRYDKSRLAGVVDTLIIETHGFAIFKDAQKAAFLRRTAKERGLIVLTDSDRAGFLIRNYIKQGIGQDCIKQAYIPSVQGKESRKRKASAEGLLGVEGIDSETIEQAILRAGAVVIGTNASLLPKNNLTKSDFVAQGLAGGKDSAQKRRALALLLGLPERISANMLLDVLNTAIAPEAFQEAVEKLRSNLDL